MKGWSRTSTRAPISRAFDGAEQQIRSRVSAPRGGGCSALQRQGGWLRFGARSQNAAPLEPIIADETRNPTLVDAAEAAVAAAAGGDAVAIVVAVGGPVSGARRLVYADGVRRGTFGDAAYDAAADALAAQAMRTGIAASVVVEAGVTLYAEVHRPPEELIVVGAGHIAVPLAQLGATLGYRVLVLDDREDFATPVRFGEGIMVRRMSFDDPFGDVPIGKRAHVILVTRAHKYDFDCLRRLLVGGDDIAYIGMIGSRRRVRAAFEALLADGVPRERLAAVHAPVGLEIGAETPAEIAVSIAAELIRHRRMPGQTSRDAMPIGDRERVLDRLVPDVGI